MFNGSNTISITHNIVEALKIQKLLLIEQGSLLDWSFIDGVKSGIDEWSFSISFFNIMNDSKE